MLPNLALLLTFGLKKKIHVSSRYHSIEKGTINRRLKLAVLMAPLDPYLIWKHPSCRNTVHSKHIRHNVLNCTIQNTKLWRNISTLTHLSSRMYSLISATFLSFVTVTGGPVCLSSSLTSLKQFIRSK